MEMNCLIIKRMRLGRILLTFALCVICACSHRAAAARVLAASDMAADQFAAGWRDAVGLRIAECRRDLGTDSSPQQREECLGPWGPDATAKAELALQALVGAQLAVKTASECEDFGSCAQKIEWRVLASQIQKAWDELRPMVAKVEGAR